jgi:RNA polymerase-binding transcription factor DksA
MFGLFSNQATNNEATAAIKEMEETRERFFVFIGKLEQKMKEFAEASLPELTELNNTDTDEYKRAYHRMKAAVLGQLDSIQKKALEVKEEKITNFRFTTNDHALSTAYYDFRNDCYDRYHQLDELKNHYRGQVEATYSENYEVKYQQILDEYEAIRNKFACVQCGSPIVIEKIYFTTTYITCPACQTRNTFEPSSKAKTLEQLGRSLAEQRTAHLLKEHDAIPAKTQELYLERHKIQLSLIQEKDNRVIREKTSRIEELGKLHEELERKRPALYQTYLRAMFDEWNKINPALTEEHEKFYNRLLSDYRKYKL